MKRTIIGASAALIVLALYLFLRESKPELLYKRNLGDSGFRYEVFLVGGSGMPGDGSSGPALVKVYDASGKMVMEKKIQTALSDIDFFRGELVISGEGSWPLTDAKPKEGSH